MSEEVDLLGPLQAGIIALLDAGVAPSLGTNHNHLLEDTQPPYNLVGDIESEQEGSSSDQYERLTFEVLSVYRGEDRQQLLLQMAAVRAAIVRQALAGDGVLFDPPWFLRSSASTAGPDGVTYLGITSFQTLGQPAG